VVLFSLIVGKLARRKLERFMVSFIIIISSFSDVKFKKFC